MKRIGVVAKTDRADAREVVERLLAWCAERGLQPVLEKETAGLCPDTHAAIARQSTCRHLSVANPPVNAARLRSTA